jgi:hypothetical protein
MLAPEEELLSRSLPSHNVSCPIANAEELLSATPVPRPESMVQLPAVNCSLPIVGVSISKRAFPQSPSDRQIVRNFNRRSFNCAMIRGRRHADVTKISRSPSKSSDSRIVSKFATLGRNAKIDSRNEEIVLNCSETTFLIHWNVNVDGCTTFGDRERSLINGLEWNDRRTEISTVCSMPDLPVRRTDYV